MDNICSCALSFMRTYIILIIEMIHNAYIHTIERMKYESWPILLGCTYNYDDDDEYNACYKAFEDGYKSMSAYDILLKRLEDYQKETDFVIDKYVTYIGITTQYCDRFEEWEYYGTIYLEF